MSEFRSVATSRGERGIPNELITRRSQAGLLTSGTFLHTFPIPWNQWSGTAATAVPHGRETPPFLGAAGRLQWRGRGGLSPPSLFSRADFDKKIPFPSKSARHLRRDVFFSNFRQPICMIQFEHRFLVRYCVDRGISSEGRRRAVRIFGTLPLRPSLSLEGQAAVVGRSSDSWALHLLPTGRRFPVLMRPVLDWRLSFPLTAAGQPRIFTGFPLSRPVALGVPRPGWTRSAPTTWCNIWGLHKTVKRKTHTRLFSPLKETGKAEACREKPQSLVNSRLPPC